MKSILKRLGLIVAAIIGLPVVSAIVVGLIGLFLPIAILASIYAAFAMSNNELNDCFTIKKVDDLIVD